MKEGTRRRINIIIGELVVMLLTHSRFKEGHDFFANTFKTPPYNAASDGGGNIIESEDEYLNYY